MRGSTTLGADDRADAGIARRGQSSIAGDVADAAMDERWRGRGTAKGQRFDRFHELWRDPPSPAVWGAGAASRGTSGKHGTALTTA